MGRLPVIVTLVLLLLLTASSVQATPPEPVEFVLAGHTTYMGEMRFIPNPENPRQIVIRDLKAEGSVSGWLEGTFSYVEDILANVGREAFVQRGEMTIQTAAGSLEIRFGGHGQLDMSTYPPAVIVEDQPWKIVGGTGDYAGLKGVGKRSTFTEGCPAEFCVRYTGRVH